MYTGHHDRTELARQYFSNGGVPQMDRAQSADYTMKAKALYHQQKSQYHHQKTQYRSNPNKSNQSYHNNSGMDQFQHPNYVGSPQHSTSQQYSQVFSPQGAGLVSYSKTETYSMHPTALQSIYDPPVPTKKKRKRGARSASVKKMGRGQAYSVPKSPGHRSRSRYGATRQRPYAYKAYRSLKKWIPKYAQNGQLSARKKKVRSRANDQLFKPVVRKKKTTKSRNTSLFVGKSRPESRKIYRSRSNKIVPQRQRQVRSTTPTASKKYRHKPINRSAYYTPGAHNISGFGGHSVMYQDHHTKKRSKGKRPKRPRTEQSHYSHLSNASKIDDGSRLYEEPKTKTKPKKMQLTAKHRRSSVQLEQSLSDNKDDLSKFKFGDQDDSYQNYNEVDLHIDVIQYQYFIQSTMKRYRQFDLLEKTLEQVPNVHLYRKKLKLDEITRKIRKLAQEN